jgi:signal transduction histidine kinase
MVDYLLALGALAQALDAADDPAGGGSSDEPALNGPAQLDSVALSALLMGTRAAGGRLVTARGEITRGQVESVVRPLALEARGAKLGEVEIYYPADAPPSEEEMRYFQLAARAVSAALHQAQLLCELRSLATDLEKRVRERTAQAVRAERLVALGTLAQGVVAELERPLAVVQANLRSIVDDIDKEMSQGGRGPLPRKAAGRIADVLSDSFLEVDRIAHLAQDLRRLVPSESSEKVRVDVNLLVESALNLSRHRFLRSVEISTDYGALPAITCHPDRLVQAFANLLVNAAEAVRGEGEIYLRTRRQGDHVLLEFRDTGVGIPEEDVPRIFEPFFTTKGLADGAGLGLATVRDVVHEHGGQVLVESTPGKGTRFKIVLPLLLLE